MASERSIRCLFANGVERANRSKRHTTIASNCRLQGVWSRIIYPDGSSINLDGMMGQDIQGMAGFHDKVDNHYKRLVGFALLTSVFTAGIELSKRQNSSLLTTTR